MWRALYGASSFQAPCGKYVIAVNQDIDPENGDAVFWALAYRANPARDMEILKHRDRGHGPRLERGDGEDVGAAEEAGAEEAVGEETPAAEAEAAESEPEQPEAEE